MSNCQLIGRPGMWLGPKWRTQEQKNATHSRFTFLPKTGYLSARVLLCSGWKGLEWCKGVSHRRILEYQLPEVPPTPPHSATATTKTLWQRVSLGRAISRLRTTDLLCQGDWSFQQGSELLKFTFQTIHPGRRRATTAKSSW